MESSWTRNQTHDSWNGRWILIHCTTREVPKLQFLKKVSCFGQWLMGTMTVHCLGAAEILIHVAEGSLRPAPFPPARYVQFWEAGRIPSPFPSRGCEWLPGRWGRAATRHTLNNYYVSQKGQVAFHKQEKDFVEYGLHMYLLRVKINYFAEECPCSLALIWDCTLTLVTKCKTVCQLWIKVFKTQYWI